MNLNELLLSPAVWGVIGSVITGFVTYRTTTSKNNIDLSIKREQFIDAQLQKLFTSYQNEIAEMKEEVKGLVAENKLLREEVIQLKGKIVEMEGHRNVKENN
ncbi:MAG: hypothetical protein ABF633_03175 [Clostridium sp.]|uniref:hypothetical protein n=1 Tax=Clostridium sp. TaxID=1506 RepID=UPI0039EA11CC